MWFSAAASFSEGYGYGDGVEGYPHYQSALCERLHAQALHKYSLRGAARARMVLLLTDGYATAGPEQSPYAIAGAAHKQAGLARYPVSVHGLAFGRDADLKMLRVLGAGSGGTAVRIYDDADMAAQVIRVFESVGQPLMTNLSFDYSALRDKACSGAECELSCTQRGDAGVAGGPCRLTRPAQASLYAGSTLVIAGRLPEVAAGARAQALRVTVRGLRAGGEAEARYEMIHTFGVGDSTGVLRAGGAPRGVMKIWAQISVGEALEACPFYLERKRKMSAQAVNGVTGRAVASSTSGSAGRSSHDRR